jgi:hypothetical protein
MTTTIDASGLAKISTGDLVRELTNERRRVPSDFTEVPINKAMAEWQAARRPKP